MPKDNIKIIDAAGKILGRLASSVAFLLMGKTKAQYQRHVFSGSRVKVLNASKLKITAKKLAEIYHARYSGHRGGLRIETGAETKRKKGMRELLRLAVYRMLPRNKLRKQMMKNLQVED